MLYFEDCPSWLDALELLDRLLRKHSIHADVQRVRVETDEEAKAARFVGSPTIRIDGEDLFPVDHENFALGCRIYQTPEGMHGWPTVEMLEYALASKLE